MLEESPGVEKKCVEVEADNERLDSALAKASGLSRTTIQRLIKEGCVCREDGSDTPLKPKDLISGRHVYTLFIPEPQKLDLKPEKVAFEVVYEDQHLVVVNKPAGVVVHPSLGHGSGTLVHGLLAHCKDLSGIGGALRPGIVHRLDKGTSGLLVVAKSDEAHQGLSKQFQKRTLGRIYQALVWGMPCPTEGAIEEPLGRHPLHRQKQAVVKKGKEAKTFYRLEELLAESKVSHIACQLATGRTHQIRVHLAWKGHSLLGDDLYGPQRMKAERKDLLKKLWPHSFPALHASHLYFSHPVTKKAMHFKANFPKTWADLSLVCKDSPLVRC